MRHRDWRRDEKPVGVAVAKHARGFLAAEPAGVGDLGFVQPGLDRVILDGESPNNLSPYIEADREQAEAAAKNADAKPAGEKTKAAANNNGPAVPPDAARVSPRAEASSAFSQEAPSPRPGVADRSRK